MFFFLFAFSIFHTISKTISFRLLYGYSVFHLLFLRMAVSILYSLLQFYEVKYTHFLVVLVFPRSWSAWFSVEMFANTYLTSYLPLIHWNWSWYDWLRNVSEYITLSRQLAMLYYRRLLNPQSIPMVCNATMLSGYSYCFWRGMHNLAVSISGTGSVHSHPRLQCLVTLC